MKQIHADHASRPLRKCNPVILGMLASASFCAVMAFAAPSAQASTYILTTTGTISDGTDALGLFGSVGSDLTGESYTLTSRFDAHGPTLSTPTLEQISGAVTGSVVVTVAGVTVTIPVTTSYGAQLQAFNNVGSSLIGLQSGQDDATMQFVTTDQQVSSATGGVTGPTLAGSAYTVLPTDSSIVSFSTSLSFDTTAFDATAAAISLSVVPEPASILLLAGGILGLGFAVRRRKPASLPGG